MPLRGSHNLHTIKNVHFNAFVGRRAHEDDDTEQPIVGIRYDDRAHNRFVVEYSNAGREMRIAIDGAEVGEHDWRVYAFVVPGTTGDDWLLEEVSRDPGRILYRICLARNPRLVWTLNLPTEPANQIHIEHRDETNPRQLWELNQVRY